MLPLLRLLLLGEGPSSCILLMMPGEGEEREAATIHDDYRLIPPDS
jgi:hypothetical protein